MADRVWLSYDLGIDGPYEALYHWLDLHKAVECGDSLASFVYDRKGKGLDAAIAADLKRAVRLRPRDRIYVIFKDSANKWRGKFVFGGRKSASWAGAAAAGEVATDEE